LCTRAHAGVHHPTAHPASQLPNALRHPEFELAWREADSRKIGCDAFLEIGFCFSFVGGCSVHASFRRVAMLENN